MTEAIQLHLFGPHDLAEVTAPDEPGERLIVCCNPLPAEERELEAIKKATRRERRPLRGKDQIGLRVGKLLNRHKVGKHFRLKFEEGGFWWERKETQQRQEAALDGIYALRTDVPAETQGAGAAVGAYKRLSRVERAFPVDHRLADPVRAHIFLCMFAYYVEWHVRKRFAPLPFQDDDRDAAGRRRTSVVAPAKRSSGAEQQRR